MTSLPHPTGNQSVDNLIGLIRTGKMDRYLLNIQQEAALRQKYRAENAPISLGDVCKIGANIRPAALIGVRVEVLQILRTRVKVRLLESPKYPCRFSQGSAFLINRSILEVV